MLSYVVLQVVVFVCKLSAGECGLKLTREGLLHTARHLCPTREALNRARVCGVVEEVQGIDFIKKVD